MTSYNDDARKSVQDTLDALWQWRKEIDAVNERGLATVMKCMKSAQEALGWPERAAQGTGKFSVLPGQMHYFIDIEAVGKQLLKSSKEDMRVIEEISEACFASLPPSAVLSTESTKREPPNKN